MQTTFSCKNRAKQTTNYILNHDNICLQKKNPSFSFKDFPVCENSPQHYLSSWAICLVVWKVFKSFSVSVCVRAFVSVNTIKVCKECNWNNTFSLEILNFVVAARKCVYLGQDTKKKRLKRVKYSARANTKYPSQHISCISN